MNRFLSGNPKVIFYSFKQKKWFVFKTHERAKCVPLLGRRKRHARLRAAGAPPWHVGLVRARRAYRRGTWDLCRYASLESERDDTWDVHSKKNDFEEIEMEAGQCSAP